MCQRAYEVGTQKIHSFFGNTYLYCQQLFDVTEAFAVYFLSLYKGFY